MTGPSSLAEVEEKLKPKEIVKKVEVKKEKKVIQRKKPKLKKKKGVKAGFSDNKGKIMFGNLIPSFNNAVMDQSVAKLTMADTNHDEKKAIRRTALEIKKAQEIEENKQSQQEKEWEIPAFLRFKK